MNALISALTLEISSMVERVIERLRRRGFRNFERRMTLHMALEQRAMCRRMRCVARPNGDP
jgi:hypothetical protein